jgi:hypothetical protein
METGDTLLFFISPPSYPILSQLNPLHNITPHFALPAQLLWFSQAVSPRFVFPTAICTLFSYYMHAICSAHPAPKLITLIIFIIKYYVALYYEIISLVFFLSDTFKYFPLYYISRSYCNVLGVLFHDGSLLH